MTNPTGAQYEIIHGEHRAVATEVGAATRVYEVAGRPVISGFAEDQVISGGRGQQLLPWPNRIRDGRYTFEGKAQQLVLSEPARHNAIHGLARHVAWTLVEHESDHVRQRVRVYPQPGWPGIIEAELTHRVCDEGLEISLAVSNIGSVAVPFGYAAHPYFTVGERVVDEITLLAPASSYLEVDDRLLPLRISPVDDTPMDLRDGVVVGDLWLDTAMTDLARDADGRWRVRLSLGDRVAELWADESFGWIQIFTGNDRRDIALAVEPMTCGPDAFNEGPTHDGMITLAAGAEFRCRWGVTGR